MNSAKPAHAARGPCACPGCPNESLGEGIAYCPACEEAAHVAHCGRCGAPIFILDRPCPACGEPCEPAKGRGG